MASSLIFLCPKNPQSKHTIGSGGLAEEMNGKQSNQIKMHFVFMLKFMRCRVGVLPIFHREEWEYMERCRALNNI